MSRAHPSTRLRRFSSSTVSKTSTFWARLRSGEYPDMSAIWSVSVTSRRRSAIRPAPLLRRMFSRTALYSRASFTAFSLGSGRGTGSTWIHNALPVPGTAVPMVPLSTPLTTAAVDPPGSSPVSRISPMTPTDEYLPSIFGTRTSLRPLDSAASTAARASSVSSVSVNTMFGRITPDVSDTSGSVTVWAWSPLDPEPVEPVAAVLDGSAPMLSSFADSVLKLSALMRSSLTLSAPSAPSAPSAWTVSSGSGESDLEFSSTGPPICSWPFKRLPMPSNRPPERPGIPVRIVVRSTILSPVYSTSG